MAGDSLPRKLYFFFFSLLVGVNLVLLSIILASADRQSLHASDDFQSMSDSLHGAVHRFGLVFHPAKAAPKKRPPSFGLVASRRFAALGSTLGKNTARLGRNVGSGLHALVHAAAYAPTSAVTPAGLSTFIKPADSVRTPVIAATPLPASKVVPVAVPTAAPAPVQPVAPAKTVVTTAPPQISLANLYTRGNCTWWASHRRAQANDPIPNSWGNAATWASRAARDGYAVDHHPSPGAIMQTANSAGGYGHVAYVESVDPDGTWHISEMNARGLGVVDDAAKSPATAANYNFIHDRS